MARDLTAGMIAAATATTVRFAAAIEAQFDSGTGRVWTGTATLSWGGNSWTGLGDLIGADAIEEATAVSAKGVALTLSGIPSSLITLALDDDYRGKPVIIYILQMNSAFTSVEYSYQQFAGRMDTMTIEDGGETATITLQCESNLVDLERPKIRRYTDEEQQQILAGDRGLEFVAALAEKPLYWGVPAPT